MKTNKKVISVSIDVDLYDRLMKVLETDDSAKLSGIINGSIKQSIESIEKLYKNIKKLKEEGKKS